MAVFARVFRPLAVAAALLLGGYGLAKASGAAQGRAQVDYLALRVDSDSPEQLEAELDKWGESGWQLVEWAGEYMVLSR
jgi:hypothetical protein